MRSLPFARLNLRRNPFGEPHPEDLGDLFVGGLEDWPAFLRGPPSKESRRYFRKAEDQGERPFLQLLGPAGCGKSTLLAALQGRFTGSSLFAWCPAKGWPPIPKERFGPLFVDDAQMLGKRMLVRVHRFPAVVAATQVDLEVSFRDAGFRVMTTWVPGRICPRLMGSIIDRRLEWARRASGPIPKVDEDAIDLLFRRHGHDLRAMLACLYDRYQQLEELR
jgi:hypothetical protein